METFAFEFSDGDPRAVHTPASLVGVVSSGNLEVLVESTQASDICRIDVTTVAAGFEPIWQAVLEDFFARHRITGIHISINDMGATPAVVGLRLDQALEEFLGAHT